MVKHSGRLDQTIGNLNTLFKAVKITDKPIVLLSNDSISFLLQPVSIDLTDKVYLVFFCIKKKGYIYIYIMLVKMHVVYK